MTKTQQKQYDKLRQRVADIMSGVIGYDAGEECQTVGIEQSHGLMLAIKMRLIEPNSKNITPDAAPLSWWNFHHYEDVDSLTEFLFSEGVRA